MLYGAENLSRAERRERALRSLEIVGLAERAHHYSSQLSGGQQQRVAIARAIANEPQLLLADEPTGNLDSKTSIEIMGVFQRLNDAGMTIIMVTHEPDIARFCKRDLLVRDGLLVSDTTVSPRTLADEELRRYLASAPKDAPPSAPTPEATEPVAAAA